jgi:hypothetical protein
MEKNQIQQPQNQTNMIARIPRKQSHKRNGNQNANDNSNVSQNQTKNTQRPRQSPKLKRNLAKPSVSAGVSFNVKKNKVDKFYCPNLPSSSTSSTKSNPTGSVEIQDLPEIPLDSLFGIQ